MKNILIVITILLLSNCAADNSYNHRCGLFKDDNAPKIVGKWDMKHDFHMYRISDGGVDAQFVEPATGVLKLCDDGLGTYKTNSDDKTLMGVEWRYIENNRILVHRNYFDDEFGRVKYRDTLQVITDEQDYQYWVDSSYTVNRHSTQPVISVIEWTLTRK